MPGVTTWLDPLRRTLDESEARIDFFFRDDDAGWANCELRALLACFRRHATPLDIAVIPQALTAELAAEICAMREQIPELIGVHQHGFAHINHEIVGKKCEFGLSRTNNCQYIDIKIGKIKLEQTLGSVDPIFTPPWNRCTETTGGCLKALGFRVLSRDATARPLALSGLKELPVSIDWFAKTKGARMGFESLGLLMANTVQQSSGPIGIMLHHAVIDEDDRLHLSDLLALLSSHRRARCNLMSNLAGKEC